MRRRWYLFFAALGVLMVPVAALVAASHEGPVRADSYRAGAASLLLVGGLCVALGLGATTIARGGETGQLALLVSATGRRTEVTTGRIIARVVALAAALLVWAATLQVGSAAIGRGFDGPLAVHVAASFGTLTLVLLASAAISTVLGPFIAGLLGFFTHIVAQAVVNLEAAADLGLLNVWNRVAHVAYNLFPRAIYSPMIVEMQNRGQGGPAAPQFEINQSGNVEIPVPLHAASLGTVLFTLFWCAVLGWLCVMGMRRRTL